MENRTTDWAQAPTNGTKAAAEACTVAPRARRRWWQFWDRGREAEQHEVEIELIDRVTRTKTGMKRLRTDVRMNRWRARQIGVRRRSVLVLKRDILPDIGGQRRGLGLRFASVTRIRRRGEHAVLLVVWCEYDSRGLLHGIIEPRPAG